MIQCLILVFCYLTIGNGSWQSGMRLVVDRKVMDQALGNRGESALSLAG